jgi:hypothetical protein
MEVHKEEFEYAKEIISGLNETICDLMKQLYENTIAKKEEEKSEKPTIVPLIVDDEFKFGGHNEEVETLMT